MKKFFKSTAFKIIGYIFLLLVTMNVFFFSVFQNGTDYTKQYETYKQVKDIELLSELKEYCAENDIHYSISNSEIAIFPDTMYELNFKISGDELFTENLTRNFYFEILEEQASPEINISTYKEDGRILEKSWINHGLYSFLLKDGHFYQKNTVLSAVLGIGSVFIGVVWLSKIENVIEDEVKRRKEAKKQKQKKQIDIIERNEC